MKKLIVLIGFLGIQYQAFCCITCNPQIQQEIYDSTFFPNLLTMLSAFIVLAIIVVYLAYLSNKRHQRFVSENAEILNPRPLTTASMVLGIGVGGFIDGIILHQIFQWHEMISNKMPPITVVAKSVNMFWDGIFHFFTLIVVMIGVTLLWKLLKRKDIDKSGKLLVGGLLLGWGLFNIVEGIIDHHLLKLHNVREISTQIDFWNYSFLAISIIILFIGYMLTRQNTVKH